MEAAATTTRRRLRRRVPRLPLLLQQPRLRAARHRRGGASSASLEASELDEDETADLVELVERDAIETPRSALGELPRPPLGRGRARRRRVARLLAEEARLPRRLARPPREGGPARGGLGRRAADFTYADPNGGRALLELAPDPELARAAVPPVTRAAPVRARRPAYLAALLALDTQVALHGQLVLGALTGRVLAARCGRSAARARAGARRRRLRDGRRGDGLARLGRLPLPAAQPAALHPAGARARLSERRRAQPEPPRRGARLRGGRRRRRLGMLGLTVLPRLDVAGAFGVPLLLVFLWRSRARGVRGRLPRRRGARAVRDVDRDLALGRRRCPASGSRTGTRRAESRSGYVWFDVMALLVAPWLVYSPGRAAAETERSHSRSRAAARHRSGRSGAG